MKYIKHIFTSLSLASIGLSPITIFTSCSCKKPQPQPQPVPPTPKPEIDPEISQHDKEGWKHAIEYIASCKHPTIYLCSPGTMQIQQMINMYLSSSFLAQELGHTYSNAEYKNNDNIFLAPFKRAYQYKTNTPIGNFGYKYKTLVDNTFGLKDIITDGINNANNMIVTNLQDFDTSLSDYDESREDYACFSTFGYAQSDYPNKGFAYDIKILEKICSLYPQDTQFNFVFTDVDFKTISSTAVQSDANTLLVKMLKKADKIYCVSEGWSIFENQDSYKEMWLYNGYSSYKTKKEIWDAIKSADLEAAKIIVGNNNPWFLFSNCEKFVSVFSTGNDALLTSKYWLDWKKLNSSTLIKPAYPWLSLESYKQLYTNNDFYTKYTNAFLNFYLYNDGATKTFNDYIIDTAEIPNNFDHNKKNLIFLLPSFMGREDPSGYEVVFSEYKKSIDKISNNYPANKWNYIFKFHPRAQNTLVLQALKLLFNDQMPSNSVVLQHVYPSEYLITLDQYLVKTGKESYYHLIDPNTFNQDKPSGIITSENLISTSVYTAMEMFANEFANINWEQTKKLVQTDAYFIPVNYQQPKKGGTPIIGDYRYFNKNQFVDFFKAFYEVDQFIDPEKFEFCE